jgi:competence protein ComEC
MARRRNQSKKFIRYIVSAVCVILICITFYNADTNLSLEENLSRVFSGQSGTAAADFKPDNTGKFMLYAIDTGNSDSLLCIAPDGRSMLVDAADEEDFAVIKSALDKYGVKKIDVLIATHPHADHIGSMDEVIEKVGAEKIYMTDFPEDSEVYDNLEDAIKTCGIQSEYAVSGMQFSLGDASVKVLSPLNKEYEDANNASIVLLVSYGQSDFLLTGDMEEDASKDLIEDWGKALDCEVLKVAHHGSRTGASEELLKAATPDVAVITCGEGNSYGHPHKETLDLLSMFHVQTLRTDLNGDIAVLTDGTNIEAYTQISQ